MLTQGNELTQLGVDDDDDFNAALSQEGGTSPTPIDPLTLPWGRLMPVGFNHNATTNATTNATSNATTNANNNATTNANTNTTTNANTNTVNNTSRNSQPTPRAATEMLPRSPTRAGSMATRSRSPSAGSSVACGSGVGGGGSIRFLGLRNLLPSDRFNEYVLGRSAKADVTAQKLEAPATMPTESNAAQTQQLRIDAKRKRHDYVHAMVSNRHCKVYCLLTNATTDTTNNSNCDSSPEMEVFVEDTSGNGTLVNGTTLLRKNERRKLHTGDVICLLNPKLLAKKLRSGAERKMYASQYSYVFVNLYEQEARHGWGVNSASKMCRTEDSRTGEAPPSTAKKGAVDVRAIKCHSVRNKSRRSLFSSTGNGKNNPQNQSANNPSLGSFLDHQNADRRRRVEEEYDLRDLLGTGTCGEVRRAIHRRTGEERAVKIISIAGRNGGVGGAAGGGAGAMSSEKLAGIRAEAEILQSLDHPYVVKLFDVFISPNKAIYLVMELIKGGDLFDRIVERERYTEMQARRLFRRILTAVHYLHEERGIVHRDLKPENILVVDRRSDVNIKLTDFGLAKNMTAEGLKTFCGTPQYFAPEVLRRRHTVKGDGRYGKEIDCWSIGVVLFILLSGSPPFDVSAGFDAVASARVVFYEDRWSSVSKEARDLVMRLLEKDPRRRMSVKDACEHAWVLVEDGDTHRHPLHDPMVRMESNTKVEREVDAERGQSNVARSARNGEDSRTSGAPSNALAVGDDNSNCGWSNVASSAQNDEPPSQKAHAARNANAQSPISSHNHKHNPQKVQPKSAPQLSQDGRRPSIWPEHRNDKTVTKAIQQSCHTSRPDPNGSPIQKRQLFDENDSILRKRMTKRGAESIRTAGNTLPKPVIDEESRLVKKVAMPRKKVQSTLFSTEGGKQGNTSKPASQLAQKEEASNKRKSGTLTVTPPGMEQTSDTVFRLNKKHKVGGKYISPQNHEDAVVSKAAVAEPAKNSELPEDELQSDFSDDDDGGPPVMTAQALNSEKKPLEKFLKKRKMESIDSSASVGIGSKFQQQNVYENTSEEVALRPVSKESFRSNDTSLAKDVQKGNVPSSLSSRKQVQSFLFGKPPPNGMHDEQGDAKLPSDGPDANEDIPQSHQIQENPGTQLQRQSSAESMGKGASVKGKQRSIKSWFQPKK